MQSGGGDECPSLGHLAGYGDERGVGYFGERYFGGEDILVEENGIWNFGKLEKALACGGRKEIKEKEKGKEMRRYFLGRENENNESGGFPGSSGGYRNLSGKYRNRPKFKYLRTTRNNYQKSRIIY